MDEVDLVIGNAEKMRPRPGPPGRRFHRRDRAVQVDDIMSVTETAGHLIDGFGTRSAPMCRSRTAATTAAPSASSPTAGAIRARCPRAWWSTRSSGWSTRLQRGGADRRRPDQLGRRPARRAAAGRSGARILKLVPDLPRLRISSIDSIEADENLMQAIATEPRLMPHLHLSPAAWRRPDPQADEAPPPARRRDRFCEEARRCGPT
jgi:threonylcarbamoyladenosine tRNA methylthiotransferase MtaB